MKRRIKVVTGASYGDEGKGLLTDFFSRSAPAERITVLHNGGAQRGHTVISPDGKRHVFHHFSSGTFSGSDTFFADSFIINPLIFAEEYADLNPTTKICFSESCRISTPFDMMTNQIIEESRGAGRHGSCGFGIWETVVRCMTEGFSLAAPFLSEDRNVQKKRLVSIRDSYFPERLRESGVEKIPTVWAEIFYDDNIIEHFLDDCAFFREKAERRAAIPEEYGTVIFEGGQGLLLSQSATNPHTTPSFTGAENPVRLIGQLSGENEIEVCYVTRSYLTRHGAGGFPQECPKSEINPDMTDETNVPNDWQGSIRYGRIDVAELNARISDDFAKYGGLGASLSVAVTHLNETGGNLVTTEGEKTPSFGNAEKLYLFYDEKNPVV